MKKCVLCGRLIWPLPWAHVGFWIRANGSEARFHTRCYTRRHASPATPAPERVLGVLAPGTETGWESLAGLSPLEQYNQEGR